MKKILLLLVTLAMASCVAVQEKKPDVVQSPPEPEPKEKVAPEPEPEITYPQKITDAGELAEFPARLAGFSRQSVYRYSPGSNYVLMNYAISNKQHRIRAQVYRFPSSNTLEQQFDIELKRILSRLKNVNIQSKSAGTEVINGNFTRYKEIRYFYTSKKSGILFGQLLVQQRGKRFYRIRSGAPQSEAQTTPPKTQALLKAFL